MSASRTGALTFDGHLAALAALEACGEAIDADHRAIQDRRAALAAQHAEDAEAVITQAVSAMHALARRTEMPWNGTLCQRPAVLSLTVDATRGVRLRVGEVETECFRAVCVGAACWILAQVVGTMWFEGSMYDVTAAPGEPVPSTAMVLLSLAYGMVAGAVLRLPGFLRLRWRPFSTELAAHALRKCSAPLPSLAELMTDATRTMATDLRAQVTALESEHVPGITADAAAARLGEVGVRATTGDTTGDTSCDTDSDADTPQAKDPEGYSIGW